MKGLYCADIITFNTVALKGSIRDVCRALYTRQVPRWLEIKYEEDIEGYGKPTDETSKLYERYAFGKYLDISDDICKRIDVEGQEEILRKEYADVFEYVDIINGTIVSIGVHPCFMGDELILTDNGYKEIKDVKIGDNVFTHNSRYKKVVETMVNESDDVYKIYPCGTLPIKSTGNHPFYVRRRVDKRLRKHKDGIDTIVRTYNNPIWMRLDEIKKGDMIGVPINNKNITPKDSFSLPYDNTDLWWLIGRYLGDGWITEMNRCKKKTNKKYIEKYLVICCNKKNGELNDIEKYLKRLEFDYSVQERESVYRIYIKNNELLEYLKKFGKYANGKFIPSDILNSPIYILENLLKGYLSADGYHSKHSDTYSFTTVSKKLALGFINVISKVYKRHCSYSIVNKGKGTIEGRVVNLSEKYRVSFTKDVRNGEKSFYENGYIWMPYKNIEKIDGKHKTYNLSVIDDNSYTVNNISVHNCGQVCSSIPLDENMGLLTLSTCENPVTMLNMKEVDSLNYVKLDILGLDNVQLINETCDLVGIERLTPQNVDDDDLDVWMSIKEDTTAIFQWDGSGSYYIKDLFSDKTINNIRKVYPKFKYIDLMSCGNGAIRPAGASYRDQLSKGIFRDNGNKELNEMLAPTLGYLVYQEQILSFLHEFCGYTMGEADIVRRGFAKFLAC